MIIGNKYISFDIVDNNIFLHANCPKCKREIVFDEIDIETGNRINCNCEGLPWKLNVYLEREGK